MIKVTNYRVFIVAPQKGVPQVYHPSISLRPLHFASSAYKNVDIDNAVIIFASDKGFGGCYRKDRNWGEYTQHVES